MNVAWGNSAMVMEVYLEHEKQLPVYPSLK